MALPAKQTKNLGFLRNLITSSAFISEISSWSPYPHLWPCKRHFCSGRRKAECPEYTDAVPCTPAACAGTSFLEVQLIFHPLAAFRNSWKMSDKVLAPPCIHGKASVGLLLHRLVSSKCPSKYNPPMFLQVMRDVQQKVFRGKVSSPNVYWASLILHDNPESSMSLNPWHTELSKETQRKKINSNNNKAKQRCSWAKRNMSTLKSKMPPSKTNSKTINLKLEPSHCSYPTMRNYPIPSIKSPLGAATDWVSLGYTSLPSSKLKRGSIWPQLTLSAASQPKPAAGMSQNHDFTKSFENIYWKKMQQAMARN